MAKRSKKAKRPKKDGWSAGPYFFDPLDIENNSSNDDDEGWINSPEGQCSTRAYDMVFGNLENADVDPKQRKIVWGDGKRLSIEQSAERIHAEHPDLPCNVLEFHVYGWLKFFKPKSYSESQLEELGRLTEPWLRDYDQKFWGA